MELKYTKTSLPFAHPFTISNGRTKTHQEALLVALNLGPFTGYGEAPAITYYNITVEKMIADLMAKHTMVEKFAMTDPERFWHYLHHLFPQNPFLVAALDIAGWDLFGQMKGKTLYDLWDTAWSDQLPMCDYTIGIDTPEKMVEKMLSRPWPIYKIKLGTPDDIGIIKKLREKTDAIFRVDANAGWTLNKRSHLFQN